MKQLRKRYLSSFIPKSWICFLEGYSLKLFRGDLAAGVTVGIIAFPVSMAFAIASGLSPERGLFTGIVAGFVIALLGGSRVQVSGAAGAFVPVIYDVLQRQGYEGLVVVTIFAGILLILMGLAKMGTLIKYIPSPLITGFTSGIAVVIFSSQIRDFFGLNMGNLPTSFLAQWDLYFHSFHSLHLPTFYVASGTLVSILIIRRFVPVIPWAIGSIALATIATWAFDLPVQTIASKFGQLPSKLPLPSFPSLYLPFDSWRALFPDVLVIAFLAGSKSLLSAVVADGLTGRHHKSNVELVASGVGNIASVMCGGIPATAVMARTATNIKTGARTPFAAMIHALTMFCGILFAAPVMSLMPLPALSAVLVFIAYNMCEKEKFFHLLRAPAGDVIVLLSAFLLTVLIDITVAVEVGMILAAFFFIVKMSKLSTVVPLSSLLEEEDPDKAERDDKNPIAKKVVPKGVEVYEINGPFFFGAANQVKNALYNIEYPPKIFILRMRKVGVIDVTGMEALKSFYLKCKRDKAQLFISEVPKECFQILKKFGVLKQLGEENFFKTIDKALHAAGKLVKGA